MNVNELRSDMANPASTLESAVNRSSAAAESRKLIKAGVLTGALTWGASHYLESFSPWPQPLTDAIAIAATLGGASISGTLLTVGIGVYFGKKLFGIEYL